MSTISFVATLDAWTAQAITHMVTPPMSFGHSTMSYDYPVTYRPDLLDVLKREGYREDSKPATTATTPTSKEFSGQARRDSQRWDKYTSGNAYILYLLNRTTAHAFRVQTYGKTPVDAVKRWYRGLSLTETWVRHCVRVVAVHVCADTQTSEAGKLLMGTQQNSFPY